MVNKRGLERRSQGRGVLRKFCFEFYALLATQFSLRRRRIRRRQGRRYVPVSVTALTALFICLFKFKIFDVVFEGVSPRAFCPKCFLCYPALFSAT